MFRILLGKLFRPFQAHESLDFLLTTRDLRESDKFGPPRCSTCGEKLRVDRYFRPRTADAWTGEILTEQGSVRCVYGHCHWDVSRSVGKPELYRAPE